jgi:hypothetical protein
MSSQGRFRLEPTSVLLVTREGGFVVTPGLSAPRRIDCQELSEPQRNRLQAVLEELDRQDSANQRAEAHPSIDSPSAPRGVAHRNAGSPGTGADGRWFHVTLEISSSLPSREWALDERAAPSALIGLWKRGVQVLDESNG